MTIAAGSRLETPGCGDELRAEPDRAGKEKHRRRALEEGEWTGSR